MYWIGIVDLSGNFLPIKKKYFKKESKWTYSSKHTVTCSQK